MIKKLLLIPVIVILLTASTASADHAWGNYHWDRINNPLTLKLGDNVSSKWDVHLLGASSDWSFSNVVDTSIVSGSTNPKNCRAVLGRVEICSNRYGNNNWLGIASIWASGNHITQGTVKVNDTYFDTVKYNTPAWRNLVMCQEIGHTFGLDHQDENFDNLNLGTCMDYTRSPSTNQHPDQHDYDMLETIYAHLDSGTSTPQLPSSNKQEVDHSDPSTWGKEIRKSSDNRGALYERDFGKGNKIFTFVIWADE